MESKQKNLPKSRKAMEYRVYWLERKLKHLKVSEYRSQKADQIEAMPEGPTKDFMHINNEFQRANEKSAGLAKLSEELNQESMKLNERTERLHDLSVSKIAAAEKHNRQSLRVAERGRKINKESLRTAALSRSINKKSQDHIEQLQKRMDEAAHLSALTRGQHQATDTLNRKTRDLNEKATKATASSLKLNRQLTNARDTADSVNQKSLTIQKELELLKAQLAATNDQGTQLHRSVSKQLGELLETQSACVSATEDANASAQAAAVQTQETNQVCATAKELIRKSKKVVKQAEHQQSTAYSEVEALKADMFRTSQDFEQQVSDLLQQTTQSATKFFSEQEDELNAKSQAHVKQVSQTVHEHVVASDQQISQALELASTALNKQLQDHSNRLDTHHQSLENRFEHLQGSTALELSSQIDQFGQDARLRFLNFDKKTVELIESFSDANASKLERFETSAKTTLDSAQHLLDLVGQDVSINLEKTAESAQKTEVLQAETKAAHDTTRQLNSETQELIQRSNHAIEQIDQALESVNQVSRKLFQETRALQGQNDSLQQQFQHSKDDLERLTQQSVEIQNDSIQTQSLSQEINQHSLHLNEQSQQLHGEFAEIRGHNHQLIGQLEGLKRDLTDLGERSQRQLEQSVTAQEQGEKAKSEFTQMASNVTQLTSEVEQALTQSQSILAQAAVQCQDGEAMLSQSTALIESMRSSQESVEAQGLLAQEAAHQAKDAAQKVLALESDLIAGVKNTDQICRSADEKLNDLNEQSVQTQQLNEETRAFQSDMKQVVAESRQINDEFMRGLETISTSTSRTNNESQNALTETRALQNEIHNILGLKQGIDDFQHTVDVCQEQLMHLTQSIEDCQTQTGEQQLIISQYQKRIESYHEDVTRYRESIVQLENRLRTLSDHSSTQELRIDEHDEQLETLLLKQRAQQDALQQDLDNKLLHLKTDTDQILDEIKAQQEAAIHAASLELKTDFEHQLDLNQRSTTASMQQTENQIQSVSTEVAQLNRALHEELETLKNQTSALNNEHIAFQQEQLHLGTEHNKQAQQYEFELETVKHKLDNYQRLMETQLDNAPFDKLQQRMKQLESNLKLQQRALKAAEMVRDTPLEDPRVTQLEKVVENLNRSMQEVALTNQDLRASLKDTQQSNHQLLNTNRELEMSLATRQNEIDHCLQRIQRLETREATFEEVVASLKTRDSDTQQTLQQMRNAVKDSTRTMRETQRTLETLHAPEKKRDWLSPKQAVMSSVFAAAVTAFSFMGFEEVNAAFDTKPAAQAIAQMHVAAPDRSGPTLVEYTSGARETSNPSALLDKTLQSLAKANASIADLGEFAWPVNFGMVDPAEMQYQNHNKGINIEGELGDPVVAINDGKVIYSANEIRGYGNMIVIQHNDDLVSIYANNQFNYVSEGDQVRRGQLIGDIGQLFNQDAAGLYLEIRQNGEATNPFNYLRHQTSTTLDMISAR